MGRVYRALDLNLGREVALKFLPELSNDDVAFRRFEREARSAAIVNHPNVCTVYEISKHDGIPFLSIELLQGKTLEHRTSKKPVAIETLLDWAIQISDGLEAAHNSGIIHRDLKPSNLFLTSRGHLKILDFGVAKNKSGKTAAVAGPQDKTVIEADDALSSPGSAIGTPAYMSPEQARGDLVDERSDLFCFGIVLYELATGCHPFLGATSGATMGAILYQVPRRPAELNSAIPVALEEVILKALEKDPEVRYQHVTDLRADLKRMKRNLDSGSVAIHKSRSRHLVRWVSLAATILAAILVLWWSSRPLPAPRITHIVPVTNDLAHKSANLLVDRSRIYYSASDDSGRSIWQALVTDRGTESLPLIPGLNAFVEHISPDHTQMLLGQITGMGQPVELLVAPVLGGAPMRLGNLTCNYQPPCAGWAPDGEQLAYASGKELHIARKDGTELRKLLTANEEIFWPRWSPDGRQIRFSTLTIDISTSRLWEVSADGSNLHPLLPNWNSDGSQCCGEWTSSGKYFLFNSGGDVWARRERARLFSSQSDNLFRLTNGPTEFGGALPSVDSKRMFVNGFQARSELLRCDLKSKQFTPFLQGISAGQLEYSRDGKRLTYVTYPDAALWRSASDGGQRLKLTSAPLGCLLPHFSRDGKKIAFMGFLPGKERQIFVVSTEGGAPEAVTDANNGPEGDWDPTWSPDGQSIAFGNSSRTAEKSPEGMIHLVDLKTRRVSNLPNSHGLWAPRWSPDGHFLAVISALDKKLKLYDVWSNQVSELTSIKGGYPTWSTDGQFVYFNTSGEERAWWRIRIRDKKLEKLRSLRDLRTPPVADWFTVAPDDALITWRDVSSDQLYALDWEGL